jgi:hypothetical protein
MPQSDDVIIKVDPNWGYVPFVMSLNFLSANLMLLFCVL